MYMFFVLLQDGKFYSHQAFDCTLKHVLIVYEPGTGRLHYLQSCSVCVENMSLLLKAFKSDTLLITAMYLTAAIGQIFSGSRIQKRLQGLS